MTFVHKLASSFRPLDPARFSGEVDGKSVSLFTLRNVGGMVVGITNYGAKIEQIVVPDRHGHWDDVVLGYGSLAGAMAGSPSMGAFIGRYAGRIGNASFHLNGRLHQLTRNDGAHCLHGGLQGSRFRVFDAVHTSADSVEMRYVFGDGEEGFPGALALHLKYSLSPDHALVLQYEATAIDEATVASFTSHAFFNLEGELSGDLSRHVMTVPTDHCLVMTPDRIATGEMVRLNGGVLDLREPALLGERLGGAPVSETRQAAEGAMRIDGYDDCYVIGRAPAETPRLCARVWAPVSGRVLEVWSTEPALQFYTGKHRHQKLPGGLGKGGNPYLEQQGFCLEPQQFPNAPNCPQFPSAAIEPGQSRRGTTVYRFSTEAPLPPTN